MGWIKQSEPICLHQDRPTLGETVHMKNKHMIGDIWQCDNCRKQFIVATEKSWSGPQWDQYQVDILCWRDHK